MEGSSGYLISESGVMICGVYNGMASKVAVSLDLSKCNHQLKDKEATVVSKVM